MTSYTKRQVTKALWRVLDRFHRKAEDEAGDSEVIRSYCPLFSEWKFLLIRYFPGDARGAADILQYYADFKVNHPRLKAAFQFAKALESKYDFEETDEGALIGPGIAEWLPLNKPSVGHYMFASPRNAVAFSFTGGDGIHYALLARDGIVDESSPVVQVDPGSDAQIVAQDLDEFLSLVIEYGHSDLVRALEDEDWDATPLYKQDSPLTARLAEFTTGLGVTPTQSSADRLDDLESTYGELMEEPLFEAGQGVNFMYTRFGAWFHIRRRIRRYLGI